jgi:hypothetical protein
MLLDQFIPDFQFREVHSILINASASRVLSCVKSLRPSDVPAVGLLMGLRSIPAFLSTGKRYDPNRSDQPLLHQIVGSGFLILGEEPNRELALGTIGQFWKPAGNLCMDIATPKQYQDFQEDGWAKAGWNFLVESTQNKTRLTTETRILALSKEAKTKFGFYWLVIRGGSGFIRRAVLKAVKRKAEGDE